MPPPPMRLLQSPIPLHRTLLHGKLYKPSLTFLCIRHSSTSSESSLIKIRTIPAPHTGHIQILTLNNPTARNAISRALLASLAQHVTSIAKEDGCGPTRAVVLGSEVDESFCAGADLKERRTFTPEDTAEFLRTLRATLSTLSALQIPTISAISSLALGGGLELALATHLRVLASTATVGLPETRLAIIPGAGGTFRLSELIGRTRALDLMLTGRRVGGPEAYFMGLADRLVEVNPDAEMAGTDNQGSGTKEVEKKLLGKAKVDTLDAAAKLAGEICEGGPLALRGVIRACGQGAKAEGEEYETVLQSQDRDEALVAFREKRKPVYKGS